MREILFRGMIHKGEWKFGDLLHLGRHHIGVNFNGSYKKYPVNNETVGQYTGLKDKNGKKIFEGDRVIFDDGDGWVVGEGVVSFEDFFGIEFEGVMYSPLGNSSVIEIIGNIWEEGDE